MASASGGTMDVEGMGMGGGCKISVRIDPLSHEQIENSSLTDTRLTDVVELVYR